MKNLHTVFIFVIFLLSCATSKNITSNEKRPVDLVEPLVDSANSRWFFFNSASRPFGMVNLSPDNLLSGAWGSGYRYNTDTIRAFSHIHAWQLSGIPVLPISGEFDPAQSPDDYCSSYSHDNEVVEAGYHKVYLDKYNIKTELTSTKRVGFHRYTFEENNQNHILLDLSIELGPCKTENGYIKKLNQTTLEGYAVMSPTRRRPKTAEVYYVIEFDKPFETAKVFVDNNEEELSDSDKEVRLMKVGISYVSIEQAQKNLQTELPHWDFNRIVEESKEEWNEMLSRIEVSGGTLEEQKRFYTDLYHALQGRRIISDVDGQYCDKTTKTKRIKQIPIDSQGKPRFNHYNSDSFWGAQWTLNTLWHLVYPEISEEFINSMLLMYKDGGLIPRGPSGGNYTYVMTGASSTPFIVSAYQKGIRGFDIDLAYEGLRKNHYPGGLMSKAGYEHNTLLGGGLEYYINRGYIPYPLSSPKYPPKKQYGFHQVAKSLGKKEDYHLFTKRSNNYKNLFDEETGWMRVRRMDGLKEEPFDSMSYDNGWVEANAVQSTWFVPHDVEGLAELMGGNEIFVNKLNHSFEISTKYDFKSSKHGDRSGVINDEPYLNYGNQPSMQTAYLFNYTGAPWLTQHWARKVIEQVYSGVSPHKGYSGDEDQGLMGALAVLMKIGIFSMDGGTAVEPFYELSSPIFDEIKIQLNPDYYSDNSLIIKTKNNSAKNKYIQSILWNGTPTESIKFLHKDIVNGAVLSLEMGDQPNKNIKN